MASASSTSDISKDICQTSPLFTQDELHVHIKQTKSSYQMNILPITMNLQRLFSTGERLRILEYVMFRDDVRVSVISRELKLSKGLVSQFMRTLQANGLVRKIGHLYCTTDNFTSREVRRIINLSKVNLRRVDKEGILGVGLHGSWARGTNTIESDVDVWVKTSKYPPQEYLAAFSSQLRKMLGAEVRLLVLTPEKLEQIEADEVFYFNLMRDSIHLWGEDIA